jgi:hypothetical protein
MKSPADMKVIQIEITNACPKRCSNCTRFCGHHQEPFFMDFETFKQAVDSMKGFKGIIGIMGGEPTIHPEFEKFVRYYRDNIGYDDFSTACYEPSSNFINHILANAYHTGFSNQRGLWTSVGPKYYEHFELIQDTFGYQLVNDHSNESMHTTLMATRKELGIPDDKWIKLRDNCWIQNLWSASITPKGAFFCEVAAAMDATLGGPGGWKIEPEWWNRKPADFADQLHWCEMCSAALPMPARDSRGEVDDVSPVWREKLVQIDSPKLKKGLANEFDPKAYDPNEHKVVSEITPYIDDEEQRIGTAKRNILPQRITSVAWLTSGIGDDEAAGILDRAKKAGRLNYVVSAEERHQALAEAAGATFLNAAGRPGREVMAEIKEKGGRRDWVLLMRDSTLSDATLELLGKCVFNPGCVYWRTSAKSGNPADAPGFQFFNARAHSLREGGDLFDIAAAYPPRKRVRLVSDDASRYSLNPAQMFYRRLVKRFYWAHKRIGKRLGQLPPPEAIGPKGPMDKVGVASS